MRPTSTLLLATALLTTTTAAAGGGTARVQVIHDCADLAAATVDVWLNNILLLDDFAFRTASPFVDAPAGITFTVGIAPPNSTMASDAIYTQDFTLTSGATYVLVASGIVSPSGYVPNPGFTLAAYDMGQETASNGANTDVLVYHGATDAPTVDVFESAVLNATAVDNASYGDFAGYLALPTADYVLQVRDAANTTIVATYAAPLATLGLNGAALVVCASGFLDPSMNSNGPAFGLWAALPAGGALVQLPALPQPTARVQVIHNSADAAAAMVDVWVNNALAVDDFMFRTATPFIDLPATIDFTVGIAPPNSDDASDAIAQFTYNLANGGTYILTANGIVSGSGYNPPAPFDLYVKANALEAAAAPGTTDILVFHGSTDAPTVDVAETAVLNATIIDDLPYGTYTDYLTVPTDDYVLQVQTSDGTPVVSYLAPLATLGLDGAAITVLASGFLDPAQNSNGPAFGLWTALATGGPLVELPIATSVQENGNELQGATLYPNPARDAVTVDLSNTHQEVSLLRVNDLTGRTILEFAGLPLNTDRIELPLSGVAPGLYQVTLYNSSGAAVIPLQVMR